MLNANEAYEASKTATWGRMSFGDAQKELTRIREEFVVYLQATFASEFNLASVRVVFDDCRDTVAEMDSEDQPANEFGAVQSIFIDRIMMVRSFIDVM